MNDDLSNNLGYKLHFLTRVLMLELHQKFKSRGVTPGQMPVLCCLNDKEGQTQAELCERIQVEQPTMANTLRRMERDGLIHRSPCDLDKRQSRIHLTDRIKPTVKELQNKRDEVLSQMTSTMSIEELESFHRLLDKAVMALQKDSTEENRTDQ